MNNQSAARKSIAFNQFDMDFVVVCTINIHMAYKNWTQDRILAKYLFNHVKAEKKIRLIEVTPIEILADI